MLLSSSSPPTPVRIKFLALLQKKNNILYLILGLNKKQRQNHVSVILRVVDNVEISGQWLLLEIPWVARGRYFQLPTEDPLWWF